ncbi:MAG: hypothetical protein ACOYUZ_04740 [Patescibacteria group bacterium]
MQKKYFYIILLMPLIFSGCTVIGAAEEVACGFISGKDQDHCYQDAAKRKDSFDTCAKIKAETFSALEGPATRDKCYLQVSEQKGDPSGCEKIEGGMISYSKEECVNSVLGKKLDDLQAKIQEEQNNGEVTEATLKEQQALMDQSQKYYELLSEINKQKHDMQMNAIRNLK